MSAESMRLVPRKVSPPALSQDGADIAGPAGGPSPGPAFYFFTESTAPAPVVVGSGGGTAAETAPDFPSPQVEESGAVAFHVSPGIAVLISAIAAHDRCTVGVLVGRLAAERARAIGCGFLARAALDHDEGGP